MPACKKCAAWVFPDKAHYWLGTPLCWVCYSDFKQRLRDNPEYMSAHKEVKAAEKALKEADRKTDKIGTDILNSILQS